MAPPNLHLFYPADKHLPAWLDDACQMMEAEAVWSNCRFHRAEYDTQAGFNVGTFVDNVDRNRGPVIFIQKVQYRYLDKFRSIMHRRVCIYSVAVSSSTDIWNVCERARLEFDDGEPRISKREALAYFIVLKLYKQDKWAGLAKYKSFLWSSDLPKEASRRISLQSGIFWMLPMRLRMAASWRASLAKAKRNMVSRKSQLSSAY